MTAAVATTAVTVVSCSSKLRTADNINVEETPVQVVQQMTAVQSENGVVSMRMEAPVMNRYDNDDSSYETFPLGLTVYSYTEDGSLQTRITSTTAKHSTGKNGDKTDLWSLYGDVVIRNLAKGETLETDTLFLDQKKDLMYTHRYVRLTSEDGMMQGYGMRSDTKGKDAILFTPFDSYGVH